MNMLDDPTDVPAATEPALPVDTTAPAVPAMPPEPNDPVIAAYFAELTASKTEAASPSEAHLILSRIEDGIEDLMHSPHALVAWVKALVVEAKAKL